MPQSCQQTAQCFGGAAPYLAVDSARQHFWWETEGYFSLQYPREVDVTLSHRGITVRQISAGQQNWLLSAAAGIWSLIDIP